MANVKSVAKPQILLDHTLLLAFYSHVRTFEAIKLYDGCNEHGLGSASLDTVGCIADFF